MSESQDYPLGHSEEEARRLAQRAALLEPLTRDVFQRAGLDRSPSSVEAARRRTAARRVTHVGFQVADLATFETDQMFDALVGRLVLLYLPDPVATLRRPARHLRPRAIVAFQEYDRSQFSQMPAGELFMQIRRWILDAFAAAGTELDMGTKLYSTFVHAGLPPPSMIAATQIACGPGSEVRGIRVPGEGSSQPAAPHRTHRHCDGGGDRRRHPGRPSAR